MSALDRFERRVEGFVSTAFARAFRSEVKPVELASALRKEADTSAAVVGRGRTLVPNAFKITLGDADYDRFENWQDSLLAELEDAVTQHARQQRYAFVGPVSVQFDHDPELKTGVFRVQGARLKGSVAPATSAIATVAHPVLDIDGHRYQLNNRRTVLGRGTDCDIVLDDPGVSRHHVEVTIEGSNASLRDLGSTNGSFVDGQKVAAARLVHGSLITIGRTRITFNNHNAASEEEAE